MAKVLVIEDELNIRRFISINLKARSYTVEEAGTGADGLGRLRESAPQVLILDMMLPDMTGWQVLDAMSQDDALKAIPVILMTASVNVGDIAKYPNVVQHIMKTHQRHCVVSLRSESDCTIMKTSLQISPRHASMIIVAREHSVCLYK